MSINQLCFIAYQMLLLEYESTCRATPSGCWLPLPPPEPKGRQDALKAIEQAREVLGSRWRSDAHIAHESNDKDEYGRGPRCDLYAESTKLFELNKVQETIEWAKKAYGEGDMLWVHFPGEKHWTLVYLQGCPTRGVYAHDIVSDEMLYAVGHTGNSINNTILKKADCSIPFSTFSTNRKLHWERAAKEILDKYEQGATVAISRELR